MSEAQNTYLAGWHASPSPPCARTYPATRLAQIHATRPKQRRHAMQVVLYLPQRGETLGLPKDGRASREEPAKCPEINRIVTENHNLRERRRMVDKTATDDNIEIRSCGRPNDGRKWKLYSFNTEFKGLCGAAVRDSSRKHHPVRSD